LLTGNHSTGRSYGNVGFKWGIRTSPNDQIFSDAATF
jgi:hypothetical protein